MINQELKISIYVDFSSPFLNTIGPTNICLSYFIVNLTLNSSNGTFSTNSELYSIIILQI